MPRGDKFAYTDRPKRKAEQIEIGYETRGLLEKSERRAWAPVTKSVGGNKSGSGRGQEGGAAAASRT